MFVKSYRTNYLIQFLPLYDPNSAWSWQVKADKDSPNLAQLQQASRGVNQATATVVASTISGKSQIEETGSLPEAMLFFSIPFSSRSQFPTTLCPHSLLSSFLHAYLLSHKLGHHKSMLFVSPWQQALR